LLTVVILVVILLFISLLIVFYFRSFLLPFCQLLAVLVLIDVCCWLLAVGCWLYSFLAGYFAVAILLLTSHLLVLYFRSFLLSIFLLLAVLVSCECCLLFAFGCWLLAVFVSCCLPLLPNH
jgi:hypothetical protein